MKSKLLAYKANKFLSSKIGTFMITVCFAMVGLITDWLLAINEYNNNIAIIEAQFISPNPVGDNIIEVCKIALAPNLVETIAFSILCSFLGFTISNIFWPKKFHSQSNVEDDNEIVAFFARLVKECLGECDKKNCLEECPKFNHESDGLLRRYLFEESKQLRDSIVNSKVGEYALDTNIRYFHLIAVEYMIKKNSKRYAVVHWIGSEPYSEKDKYKETYDELDFHFLHVLLKKLIEQKRRKCKIQWLLIGDVECMKNNFDYIFYIIKKFNEDKVNDIKKFFEFYIISEKDYVTVTDTFLPTAGVRSKELWSIKNEPSFGVFGDDFMFADSSNAEHHGSIYTSKYSPNNEELLSSVNSFFSDLLKNNLTHKEKISELLQKYNEMLEDEGKVGNDYIWEKHLETIWHPK